METLPMEVQRRIFSGLSCTRTRIAARLACPAFAIASDSFAWQTTTHTLVLSNQVGVAFLVLARVEQSRESEPNNRSLTVHGSALDSFFGFLLERTSKWAKLRIEGLGKELCSALLDSPKFRELAFGLQSLTVIRPDCLAFAEELSQLLDPGRIRSFGVLYPSEVSLSSFHDLRRYLSFSSLRRLELIGTFAPRLSLSRTAQLHFLRKSAHLRVLAVGVLELDDTHGFLRAINDNPYLHTLRVHNSISFLYQLLNSPHNLPTPRFRHLRNIVLHVDCGNYLLPKLYEEFRSLRQLHLGSVAGVEDLCLGRVVEHPFSRRPFLIICVQLARPFSPAEQGLANSEESLPLAKMACACFHRQQAAFPAPQLYTRQLTPSFRLCLLDWTAKLKTL